MWYPESEFLRAATDTQRRVQHCVKWKSDGIRFAVGLYPNRVGIWDILTKKVPFVGSSVGSIFSL
jgi:hypothetical protein